MNTKLIATGIVQKLVTAGYTAYFAGGWVRDYMMGHPSEDIDIATNAPPEKVLSLFPRTILVGLAFGVVVVVIDGHQFEVATFRRDVGYEDGRKPTQIELSTAEEDASRRDFTINGMFYDPLENTVHDFVQGAEDLKRGVIRAIGDPDARFVEDRLRMIRAVRFAARFGFRIDPETESAIAANADTLFPAVAMERIWQEFGKMAKYPRFDRALIDMHRLGLLPVIFPALQKVHLDTIKARVSSFSLLPSDVSPPLFLMELFPKMTIQDAEELCTYLHMSNVEANLAKFFISVKDGVDSEHALGIADLVAWVQKYAHPAIDKCLHIIAARLSPLEKEAFLQKHRIRMAELEPHIQRAREKSPIVSAAMLQEHGIKPGKQMGVLIKEGERLAILHDLRSPNEVLSILGI